MTRVVALLAALAGMILQPAAPAAAQSGSRTLDAGVLMTSVSSGEFGSTDAGVGGRLSWRPTRLIGLEAELTVYPAEFPGDRRFSRGLVEGLFGATVGPTFGRVRPVVRLRPGFVIFRAAREPFGCIAVFPPPLSCTLGSGRTVPAVDIGGGLELYPTERIVVRADLGDRLVKYPGPVFDDRFRARPDGFLSHDRRVAVGIGVRF